MNIHKSESLALDKNDIRSMMNVDVGFFDYDKLGEFELDDLFRVNDMCIILMHIHNADGSRQPVGHWIALLRYHDHIEHFDSYGLTVDQELHITHESKHLSRLLRGKNIKQDNVRLQEVRNDVNTCGRHCAVRCMTKNISYENYVKFLHSLAGKPDESVTLMTFFSH